MIGSRTDVIDPSWPGPCWQPGCCWSPPPAVVGESPEDVTLCCLCRKPVDMTETAYVLRDLVTHAACGAPVIIEAEIVVCETVDAEARS